jgi:ADP-ribose pyrophosphatase YjhB (NUDIX family)
MNSYPIPVARVILEDLEKGILLLERASKESRGKWCLPGGKVDCGKTVEEAGWDEVREETNLSVRSLDFLFYLDGALPYLKEELQYITFYFHAREYSGNLMLNSESSDSRWVKPSELKNYEIVFGNDIALKRYLKSRK